MAIVVTAIPHCTLFHIITMNIFECGSPSYIILFDFGFRNVKKFNLKTGIKTIRNWDEWD